MEIKSKTSHYFVDIEIDKTTIWYEDKEQIETAANDLFIIIETLIEGCEDKNLTVEQFLKERGYGN